MKLIEHKIENKTVILKLNKKQRKLFKKLISEYPNQRFISYKKGYLDMATGLLWEKFQDKENYNYEDAFKIKRGKYKLPTIEELETLVDKTINKPATKLPDMIANFYWSSSTYASSINGAWYVRFNDGNSNNGIKTKILYVRCVKPGPFRGIYRSTR